MKTALKTIFVVLVILGSWIGTYHFIFQKQLHDRASLRSKAREQACVISELQTLAHQTSKAQYEVILGKAIKALDIKVASFLDVSDFVAKLTRISKSAKVNITSFETSEMDSRVVVQLGVSGKLKPVFEFLNGALKMNHLVQIEGFNYENHFAKIILSAERGGFDVENISAKHIPYRCGDQSQINVQPVEIPWNVKSAEKAPAITRNPFIEQTTKMTAQGLHLVGLIRQGKSWLAMIEDEHSLAQIVRVGDRLPSGFQVTGISHQGVGLVSGSIHQTMSWRQP